MLSDSIWITHSWTDYETMGPQGIAMSKATPSTMEQDTQNERDTKHNTHVSVIVGLFVVVL